MRSASKPKRNSRPLKIGSVELGLVPRIVLGVAREDHRSLAAAFGVDILELRIDHLAHLDAKSVTADVRKLRRLGLPIIATVRSVTEGGAVDLTDRQRAALYDAVLPLVDSIDIEVEAAGRFLPTIRRARQYGATLVLSYHDFATTPANPKINQIVRKAEDLGADIVKIALTPKSSSDVFRLLAFTSENRDRNLVTISMGATGSFSRLIAPIAGSLMTYTSMKPIHGQIPLERLVDDLRLYDPRYNEDVIVRHQLLEYA